MLLVMLQREWQPANWVRTDSRDTLCRKREDCECDDHSKRSHEMSLKEPHLCALAYVSP